MTIQIDSREKAKAITKIISEFDKQGINHFSSKLPVGDYASLDRPRLVIDRKQSLGEIAGNLFQDHKRFYNEVRLAKGLGIKLIILCEHSNRIKCIQDVAGWESNYTKVSGRDLMERIYQVHISYGVEFLFCDKLHTGKKIIELLGDSSDH